MEPNLPVIARRVWSVVRVMFFMVRKGVSKRLMLELNMMMKRGKIAGKAIHNFMLHYHHHWSSAARRRPHQFSIPAPRDYEFSCSSSPAFRLSKRARHHTLHHSHFFPCAHAPPTDDDAVTLNAVKKVVEMMLINSEAASPALPGFGRSPMVRQLRITDSPFPLPDGGNEEEEAEEDIRVDEAAEAFISKFYNDLRKQNIMG